MYYYFLEQFTSNYKEIIFALKKNKIGEKLKSKQLMTKKKGYIYKEKLFKI